MHELNLDKLLYRILLGYYYIYIDDQAYKIVNPSIHIKYEAELLYERIIEENKYNTQWLTDQEIELYLFTNKIWNKEQDAKLKTFEKSIEDTKIDIYKNFINVQFRKKLKNELKSLKNQLNSLLTKKTSMNYLGIKDHAISIKNEFIIRNCIYNKYDRLVFDPNEDDCSSSRLQIFVKEIVDNSINIDHIKQLARSDTWRSIASACSIEKDIFTMSDDYKYLINLYKMYDNARQHPDAPSEDIINDDDALDGWFLVQHRKNKEEKKKNAISSKMDGKKIGQHNFIFASSEEEAKEIHEANSPNEKFFAEQLVKYAGENPGTKWEDIPIVQTQIQNELSEQLKGCKK